MKEVLKKDGRVEKFNKNKIYLSIFLSTNDYELSKRISEEIDDMENLLSTEDIEKVILLKLASTDVSKKESFENGRIEKQENRNKNTSFNNALNNFFNRDESIVNENANKDSKVFNTQRDLLAGTVGKAQGLSMLPKEIANAHIRGDIHFHDLDYSPLTSMTNCCIIDLNEMFENGFQIGNALVDTPNSIQTATAQISQIIANVASTQYGGCSLNRIDEVLAPFALKNAKKHYQNLKDFVEDDSKLEELVKKQTAKDIFDAMQSLEYEINTLFSANGQTPFVSVGFGLSTDWIGREIQKSILKIRIDGLGKDKRTAIFPKLIFTIKKGVNFSPSDVNYDIKQLALECSTKRMYPDILNYDTIVDITGNFKIPMGLTKIHC